MALNTLKLAIAMWTVFPMFIRLNDTVTDDCSGNASLQNHATSQNEVCRVHVFASQSQGRCLHIVY